MSILLILFEIYFINISKSVSNYSRIINSLKIIMAIIEMVYIVNILENIDSDFLVVIVCFIYVM